jgi:serpin B
MVTWALISSPLLACHGSEASQPGAAMSEAGSVAPPPAAAGTAGAVTPPAAGTRAPNPAGSAATEGGKGGSGSMQGAAGAKSNDAGAGGSKPAPVTSELDIQRSSVGADTAPSLADADYSAFISHINKFGLDLGQQVASGDLKQTNLIYSPLSATLALAMTYAGAKGETAAEMKTVLGDTFADGVFHIANNRLTRELASRVTSRPDSSGAVHKIELNIADAIFLDRSVTLESPFLDVLSRNYDTGVSRLDFIHAAEPARTMINTWVEEQTKDKIQDLLPSGSITDATRLVLVNALYFYGSWLTPFTHSATSDAAFKALAGTSVQVPTMHSELNLAYRAAEKFELAELPYEGSQLRMTIVLPAQGQFEAVRSQVSAAWLEQTVTGLQPTRLAVSLPKFKMTVGSFSLTEGLKAAGMNRLFSDNADLSGIATGLQLSVSDVFQKAFIAVDENGTEAAAATAVIIGTTSVQLDPPKPFIVDRPFLFFIRDANGAVLFSGHVVDPSK